MNSGCHFCSPERPVLAGNEVAYAIADGFPVSDGHALVIPKAHLPSVFDLSPHDLARIWELVAQTRALLAARFHPDGFNIGINDGPAAGQTVPHAHIHLIPRYAGDCPDPRGGVRWVLPQNARYWRE